MKPWLKDYFTFNTSEKYGIIGLISLIVILLILPYFVPLFQKHEITDYSEFAQKVEAAQNNQPSTSPIEENLNKKQFPSATKEHSKKTSPQSAPINYFSFNPNTATEDDFVKLGISKRTASNIIKYRSKGGNFKKPEDFAKIYGLSESQFQQLKPFINIPKVEYSKPKNPNPKATIEKAYKPEPIIIDIALADTTELKKINGVGSVFAKRIVKFRNSLGGFHSKSQISEVYGIDEEKLTQIQPQISFSAQPINKININTADSDLLGSHPYISYKVANAIEKYRIQHGNYANIDELKKILIIDDELFHKIQPYITI